jgi:hypothetical protein
MSSKDRAYRASSIGDAPFGSTTRIESCDAVIRVYDEAGNVIKRPHVDLSKIFGKKSRVPLLQIGLSSSDQKNRISINCCDSLRGLTKQNYVTHYLVYYCRFHCRSDCACHYAGYPTSRLCCYNTPRHWRFNCWRIDRPLVLQTGARFFVSPRRSYHVDHRRAHPALYLGQNKPLMAVARVNPRTFARLAFYDQCRRRGS